MSYSVVKDFEEAVASMAGSKYAVAVDNCTNALFLCCKFFQVSNVLLPARTYVSVPCAVIHAGGNVSFEDVEWKSQGWYWLHPYPIIDAAHLFYPKMYVKSSYFCISFSATKPINIGKGGMILTDDADAVSWFKRARYCGRNEVPLLEDSFDMLGWNMYMTPEQAARGLLLMNSVNNRPHVIPEYPDLSKCKIYQSQC